MLSGVHFKSSFSKTVDRYQVSQWLVSMTNLNHSVQYHLESLEEPGDLIVLSQFRLAER